MRPGGAKTAAPAVWVGVILLLALLAACTPEDGRADPPLITGIATLTPEGGHTGPPLQILAGCCATPLQKNPCPPTNNPKT